jgi:hypothetical protein
MEQATDKFIREVILGALFIGYVRLVGYLCLIRAWDVDAPFVATFYKAFVYFLMSLLAALAAVALFFWANACGCRRTPEDTFGFIVRLFGVCKAVAEQRSALTF